MVFRKSKKKEGRYPQQLRLNDRKRKRERETDTVQGYCPFREVGSSHIRAALSLSMSSKEKAGAAGYVGINTAQQVTLEANYIAPATLPPSLRSASPPAVPLYTPESARVV